MKAIVNRNEKFGTINGVIRRNEDVLQVINKHTKAGTAKLLIDTEDTLMYELTEEKKESNLNPIFEQILKPFMP